MEYDVEIMIAAPPAEVAAALMDPARWPEWQRGLATVTPLDGPAAPARGARRELRFAIPGRDMTMVETLVTQTGTRYDAIYVSGPVWNLCENELAGSDGGTIWRQHNTWRFEDVVAGEDDRERFEVTTRATMEDLRALVETGRRVPAAG